MRKSLSKYNKELSELIAESHTIVLVCHKNPDGDTLGSMLGLYQYLKDSDKKCSMISPSKLPHFLLWMDDMDKVTDHSVKPENSIESVQNADLIFMLDFNQLNRTAGIAGAIESSNAKKILIDHHPDPKVSADLIISEPGFSSTAELVFELVSNLENGPYLDKKFIEAIYVGMMTDTGNFNFGTYNGDTLRIVALMLDAGLDKDKITDKVYDNFSISRLRLKAYALHEKMVYYPQNKTAYIHLSQKDFDRFEYAEGDTEGFVNLPLSVKGVVFSVLFTEKKKFIKLSLRSKGSFDVNRIASKYFNGGGHRNASGGRYYGTMSECLDYFNRIIADIPELRNK